VIDCAIEATRCAASSSNVALRRSTHRFVASPVRLVFLTVLACALVSLADAQSFEVATVKPTPPDQLGPGQPSIVQFLPNGFRRTNSTLRTLVRTAYDVQDYQVVGGPGWSDTLRFDIEARHGGSAPRNDVLQMLQALLAERFALTVRRETREGPTYELVRIAGAKVPSEAADSSSATVRVGEYSGHRSMSQLAQYLAGIVGRPVVDRTGMPGTFDLHLSFAPDLRNTDQPSIFAALQEQLGLRLDASRGPFETVVIDRASLPDAN